MSGRNLFTGIVKNENDVTELLVNLMQQKFFRDICLRWFLKDSISCPRTIESIVQDTEAYDITTQYWSKDTDKDTDIDKDKGIPDIRIQNSSIENVKCSMLIENKIHVGTELTDHQKKGDYCDLIDSNANYKVCFFLIPRYYQFEWQIKQIPEKNHQSVEIVIVYWDDFLAYLNKQQVGEISYVYKDALEQMQNVIDYSIIIDTRLLPHEQAILSSQWVHGILNNVDEILENIPSGSGSQSVSKNGIGYYKGHNFIGLSPKVKNVDYFLAESSFSKVKNGDYSEWSDSEDGYWNYRKLKKDVSKLIPDNPLSKYIYQQKVLAIYTFADKIVELCRQYIRCNADQKFKFVVEMKNAAGIGCYFNIEEPHYPPDADYFIGFDPEKGNLYLSQKDTTKIDDEDMKDGDFWWHPVLMNKTCLYYDDLAQQQRAFNKEAKKALEELMKSKSNEGELKKATPVLSQNVKTDTNDNTPLN